MGAREFSHQAHHYTAYEAYLALVDIYGKGMYGGEIDTCEFGNCKLKLPNPSEENIDKAYQFIFNNEYGHKWVADYIDLGFYGNDSTNGKPMHKYIFYGLASE